MYYHNHPVNDVNSPQSWCRTSISAFGGIGAAHISRATQASSGSMAMSILKYLPCKRGR